MVDRLTNEVRSRLMAAVRSSDTGPERRVRSAAHALGLRFRLHRRDLPGTPDLTFPKHQTIIFVHGCFWHRHAGCRRGSIPKTRTEFWTDKFDRNVRRDAAAVEQLEAAGWRVLVVWECETRDRKGLEDRLRRFLDKDT